MVDGRIIVSQPRRIAARTLAHQVAHLANWNVGKEVGYEVRFEKKFFQNSNSLCNRWNCSEQASQQNGVGEFGGSYL